MTATKPSSPLIVSFPSSTATSVSAVGGKGFSLIKGAESGLPVPPGFVLTVTFFAEWFDSLQTTPEWSRFLNATTEALPQACNSLKTLAADLKFNADQSAELQTALSPFAPKALFAVRSSSPEEDLEGASFAGGYETILGVNRASMEAAVTKAFASCLDNRVVVYKKEHGFDWKTPTIAVVIQEQIASAVSGVAFSLNPVTNNYDEVVINSNWGLGETVVAGAVTPDSFTVNKTSHAVIDRTLGTKETSIWLNPSGGTTEKRDEGHARFSLTDSQIADIANLTARVEEVYGKPVDIEWGIAAAVLYLLQARPITTHVPLDPQQITAPGQPKNLFLDATISIQGLYKPLSPMGTSVLAGVVRQAGRQVFGIDDVLADARTAPACLVNGRLYVNLTRLSSLIGKERLFKVLGNMDPLAVKTIEQPQAAEYFHDQSVKHPTMRLLWQAPVLGYRMLEATFFPDRLNAKTLKDIEAFRRTVRAFPDSLPVKTFAQTLSQRTFEFIFTKTMPLFLLSRIALELMKTMVGPEQVGEVTHLEQALPNNITTEMGLELYKLSQMPATSPEFSSAWSGFLERFGHRGPIELDIASPRYRDRPQMLLEQIDALRSSTGGDDNPESRFMRAQRQRQEVYEKLCGIIAKRGKGELDKFRKLYKVWETFGGYREMHKYCLILAIDRLRERLLLEAETLVKRGLLDDKEQIFDLTLDDLGIASNDPNALRARASENHARTERIARLRSLPTLIDSRGLILRPPSPPLKEGEVAGTAISAGTARGRIKVLHSPDEKPFLRGEILVARATDPGWTPLFVNAAAIILEVGGMLQHGALVAREYGLPCVSGIPDATTLWQDGTEVEVDGNAGIIRVVSS